MSTDLPRSTNPPKPSQNLAHVIIQRFAGPIPLAVLLLAVFEAVMLVLAYRADGVNQRWVLGVTSAILIVGFVGVVWLSLARPELFHTDEERQTVRRRERVLNAVRGLIGAGRPRCLGHLIDMLGADVTRLEILDAVGHLYWHGWIAHHPDQPDCWVWREPIAGTGEEVFPPAARSSGRITSPTSGNLVGPGEVEVEGFVDGALDGDLYLLTGRDGRYWPSSKLSYDPVTMAWRGKVNVGQHRPTATISLVLADRRLADLLEFYRVIAVKVGHAGVPVSGPLTRLDEVLVAVRLPNATPT